MRIAAVTRWLILPALLVASNVLWADSSDWRVYYTAEEALLAIQATSRSASEQPANSAAYVQRGNAYFYLRNYTRALAQFDRALEIDPDAHLALFGRGMALGRAGDIEGGVNALTDYLAQHPRSSLAYTKRGIRLLWLQDLDRARSDFERAIELDASNAEAHDDLGVVHARHGDLRAAERLFKQAIALEPGYQKAFHNLALAYYLGDRIELALQVIDDALSLQPDSRDSVMLKAVIKDAMGEADEAAALKEHARTLSPRDWSERSSVD